MISPDLPHLDYESVRPEIRNADIVFFCGNGLLSRAIKRVTNSPYSHVGMAFWAENRVMLHEAFDHGVRTIRLSKKIAECNGQEVILARCAWVTPTRATRIYQAALDRQAVPYDWKDLLRVWFRIRFMGRPPLRNSKLICSEYVEECYREAGYYFPYNERGFIVPADIFNDPSVTEIASLA